jgi:pimeloyl-ACP methyl ester carboxylesterase
VLARWRVEGGEAATRDAYTPFGEGRGALRTAKQWLELIRTTSAREDFVKAGLGPEALARALTMPLLLIYGEHSRCLPTCRALHALLPHGELEMIPQGGHFFPMSHGPQVLQRLRRFLDGAASAGTPNAAG